MPRHYNKASWKTQYDEPDVAQNNRRVSFRPQKRHSGGTKLDNRKDWSAAIREHLNDEDIDMSGMQQGNLIRTNHRYGKNRRGGGSGGHNRQDFRRKLMEGTTSWYRVTISHGQKYEKDFLQKLFLDNLAPMPFVPIQWANMGQYLVVFYIEGFKIAEKVLSLDRQLQLPDGFRLNLRVQPGTPDVDVTSEVKEKIKLVMAKRYNAVNKALDLTNFHKDPDFQDLFCALFKPIVFITVMDIIVENIPEIEALNLADNNVTFISFMKKVVKSLPNLKILHMGKNKIKDITQLDVLIGLPIVDLVLDGNPLCERFQDDKSTYISEVRKRFPKVITLDGFDLPPPIGFDIQEEATIPETKQTFLCNAQGQDIVRQFLQQYYELYDTNRNLLAPAYHDNAIFSLTMAYPYGNNKDKSSPWLNWYNTTNRNIIRITDTERRFKLLKRGKVDVCNFLDEMPMTKHDIHSFTVDMNIFTPVMLSMTVTGIFKELKSGHKVPPYRYFFRTMVIVPAGTGFCIINDAVHITNATPNQAKEAFKTPVIVAPAPPVPVPPVPVPHAVPSAPNSSPAAPTDEICQQLCVLLHGETRMNLEWCRKCLEETQWDNLRALAAFRELNAQGRVPPEAFL